jgi:alkylated DNA repair dioxygenase AlkB
MSDQLSMFASASTNAQKTFPAGFKYQSDVITRALEEKLLARITELPFKEFEFHGFLGKRRTVSFGWRYDFNKSQLEKVDDIPEFLLPLRETAARFAGIDSSRFQQALVLEYSLGSAIGWHRDRPQFGEVIGVSLLAPCVFRLRRKAGDKWERFTLTAEPRSAYLLSGPSRTEWEHSIPPVDALRYSVTFRSFRETR